MRAKLIALACLLSVSQSGAADRVINSGEPAIVKIITRSSDERCKGYGTGFFITPDGMVMTAAHVVPSSCADLTIFGTAKGDPTPFKLLVSQRSGLDVAVLRPEIPRKAQYLKIVRNISNRDDYKDKSVVVSLFYPDYVEPSYTEALISAVRFVGNPDSQTWELATIAANPGRSGSPVILEDVSAVAVFVARPDTTGDKNSNRALIVPIAYLKDLRLPNVDDSAALSTSKTIEGSVKYAFPVDITVNPKLDGNAYYFKGSNIVEDSADFFTAAKYLTQGYELVRARQMVSQEFRAREGFIFHEKGVEVRATSLNPTVTPLPNHVCTGPSDILCWSVSPDKKTLSVRFLLYSGRLDLARGWLVGEVIAQLARE